MLTQLKTWLTPWLVGAASPKAAPFAINNLPGTIEFGMPSPRTLVAEGYQRNSAVFACISALAFAFPEPPVQVVRGDTGEPLPNHPLLTLLNRPNNLMGLPELLQYTMVYMAIGGNAYWYKVRNRQGRVTALEPYHSSEITPISGAYAWELIGYAYHLPNGQTVPIPPQDIVHFKWPSPDPAKPWLAQPPLQAASREVGTDNEMTRYLQALLANDATPRTLITMPPGLPLTEKQLLRMKEQFRARYGGRNRGDVAILEEGAAVSRLSLDLQELAFEAMHAIPETRIAAALRVPPMIVGLSSGLNRSTYANYSEARQSFTQDTLAPLWVLAAGEMTSSLVEGENVRLQFDTSRVGALQENTDALWARILQALSQGVLTVNEARRGLNMPDVVGGDVFYQSSTVLPVRNPDAAQPEPAPPQQSAQPRTPEHKALHLPAPQKARSTRQRRRLERRLETAAYDYLRSQYRTAAAFVRRQKAHSKALPEWYDQLPLDDGDGIASLMRPYYTALFELAYTDAATTLAVDLVFDLANEDVQEVLADLANLVRRVADTTREQIRRLVGQQAAEGWTIDDLAERIAGLSDIHSQNRARQIAVNETNRAYSAASYLGYEESDVVTEVEWVSTIDKRTSDVCRSLNGKRVPLGSEFLAGIKHPPGHAGICRSAIAPVVEV